MKNRVLKITGKVKHYAWGGYNFIPELLGIKNETNEPYAEYWMGAHSSAPAEVVVDGKKELLNQLIQQHPSTFIGNKADKKFGELPYLFKVLDVKDMLSIQVHPTKEEAAKGFAAEEAAGISINAVHRNYKDKNHKPEVVVALSNFWLLHGFKNENELRATLKEVPEFNFLLPVFNEQNYYGLYKTVMELPQEKVDEILLPLIKREVASIDKVNKNKPAHWINKLYKEGEEIKNIDRGIFSIYFFNIVQLALGEAIFQGAGIPHAYLEGQNVELMANSDNVLRGGLTPKHIDVAELLSHTTFEGIKPNILKGDPINNTEKNYPCPVEDFGINSIELKAGKQYHHKSSSAEIYILIEGAITFSKTHQHYKRGESFYVLPETEFTFIAEGKTLIYKAFVPE